MRAPCCCSRTISGAIILGLRRSVTRAAVSSSICCTRTVRWLYRVSFKLAKPLFVAGKVCCYEKEQAHAGVD